MKRALFATVAAALVIAATETLALLGIRLSRPFVVDPIRTRSDIFREQSKELQRLLAPDSSRLLALDPLLGWRYRAGHRDSQNAMNAAGVRSLREYTPHSAPGVLRAAAFGDSFVYGNEVGDSTAWPALMERLFPHIEVLNYGVGGYGVDQAFLRFCVEGMTLSPRVVIIGFVRDDLRRVVNVYRRFISSHELPLVKPRFTLDARGDLVLLPNPLPHPSDYERYLRAPQDVAELGAHDYWYHAAVYRNPLYDYSATIRLITGLWLRIENRYLDGDRLVRDGKLNPSSTAFRIQVALFERFAAAARAAGARPIVVLFPDMESVAASRRGEPPVLAPLMEALVARGLEYVDLTLAFRDPSVDSSAWFMGGGHYSPAGNRVVAESLGKDLLARTAHRSVLPARALSNPTVSGACPTDTVRQLLPPPSPPPPSLPAVGR